MYRKNSIPWPEPVFTDGIVSILSALLMPIAIQISGRLKIPPVGLAVAVAGVLFAALAGWRIVPAREQKGTEGFDTGAYLLEARIREGARAAGKTVGAVEKILEEADAQIIGMIRNNFRVSAPNSRRILQPEDILIIEADPEAISGALSSAAQFQCGYLPDGGRYWRLLRFSDADRASEQHPDTGPWRIPIR